MELNDILRKVRQLVAVAEHESTPVEEAQAAREAADRLMLKFAIDEAELDASRPAESRSAPGTLDVDIPGDSLLVGYFAMMLLHVARHTRTKARLYTEWDPGTCTWKARVYGFESDLRYFEILYTTLLLHMSGVLVYKWDESKTVGENAYLLHEAGFNWVEMAEMRGWRKVPFHRYPDIKNPYRNAEGQVVPSNKFGPMFKKPYLDECKRRGTIPVRIPPGGGMTYRRSAANGYSSRIGQRLSKVETNRDEAESGALVLRRDDLDAFFRDQNPDMFLEPKDEDEQPARKIRRKKYVPPPFNGQAYARGTHHADSADIGGTKVSEQQTGQLT